MASSFKIPKRLRGLPSQSLSLTQEYLRTVKNVMPTMAYIALGVAAAGIAVYAAPALGTAAVSLFAKYQATTALATALQGSATWLAAHTPALLANAFSYLASCYATFVNNFVILQGQFLLSFAPSAMQLGYWAKAAVGTAACVVESAFVMAAWAKTLNQLPEPVGEKLLGATEAVFIAPYKVGEILAKPVVAVADGIQNGATKLYNWATSGKPAPAPTGEDTPAPAPTGAADAADAVTPIRAGATG